ncbi:fibrillin [Candidatus Woesearchaeota archaeon CG10_big_fil_rev_8_21_14_0_10_30_7]|nr:MAG: fibrillin [Candidatus Woesearchaeota archaeon CG10_big_fil_rev_8_21_14_0_10_30_7]
MKIDPYHSKLIAAIKKKVKIDLRKEDYALYLGASTGTTVSYVAEIVKGVFAVEIGQRVMRELVFLAEERKNISPILEDANHPEKYGDVFCDWLFQDVAQKNQVEIFLKNFKMFKPRTGILVIKARNIDASKKSEDVFKKCEEELKKEVKIIEQKDLSPYQKDHKMYVVK